MNEYLNFLQTGLDGASERQSALTNNIANADTPGYKREDVDFRSTLRGKMEGNSSGGGRTELRRTHPGHLAGRRTEGTGAEFKRYKETDTSYRYDENNVDIEREMAELSKNEIYFSTLSQQINAKFNNLGTVLERGG